MKAIAIKVRDTICENGEFCEAMNQMLLMCFGVSVIGMNISYLV
jgi:hypothetical protein